MYTIHLKSILIILSICIFSVNAESQNNDIFKGGLGDGSALGTLGSEGSEIALPVTLLSFTFQCNEDDMILRWSTASETNNNYFTIERSQDGSNWLEISKISGAGNSNSEQNYSFEISELYKERAYYRLVQTDYDGNIEYFQPILGQPCEEEEAISSFYIITNNGTLNMYFSGDESLIENIKIISTLGEEVYSTNTNIKQLDLSHISNGSYILIMNTGHQQFHQKFVINN